MRGRIAAMLLVGVGLVASSATASATTSGWVKARLTFYQNQAGYCPASRTCTHANYLEAQYHTYQPIMNAQVIILDDTTFPFGSQIGAGVTDNDGNVLIQWTSSANRTAGHVYFKARQADGGFQVTLSNGAPAQFHTSNASLPNGTTQSSPTDWGTIQWGSSSDPNPYLNVYDGAVRTWLYSIQYSWTGWNLFWNVTIKGFDSSSCPTSCAGGTTVTLDADGNTPFAYSPRVAHELGHIISELASQNSDANPCVNYGFNDPNTSDDSGWNYFSQEWQCAAFEEAYATFVGDVGRYWEAATQPETCWPSDMGACSIWLEPSSGGTCSSGENRWPLTSVRFLWDVLDNNQDSAGGNTDTLAEWYGNIVDMPWNFAVGTGNHQRDEPFANPADLDGKGVRDYTWIYEQAISSDLDPAVAMNCSPPGD